LSETTGWGSLNQLTDLLRLLKPDFWPKTEEDWQLFSHWMKELLYSLGSSSGRRYPELLANGVNDLVKEGYDKIPSRLEKHGISMADITHLPDFVNALQEWAEKVGADYKQVNQVYFQLSLFRQAQLSRQWHEWLAGGMNNDKETSGKSNSNTITESSSWLTFIDKQWASVIT